nr:putative nucleotidyltransferase, ribonuclease H [Tanacetum cinerariifolium]
METFVLNYEADYYSGIKSITFNGKNAYELRGKFFDDLHNNTFSGTNRKDAVEHIEHYLKIIDPIRLPNVDHGRLRIVVYPISLTGGNLPGAYHIRNSLHYQDLEWYEALEDSELKDEALRNKDINTAYPLHTIRRIDCLDFICLYFLCTFKNIIASSVNTAYSCTPVTPPDVEVMAVLRTKVRTGLSLENGVKQLFHQKAWGTRLKFSTAFHPQTDGQSERTIQTLEDMLRSCALEWTGNWDDYICLVEFAYNNSWHASIKCAPFEMLYGRKCRALICWDQIGERVIEGPEMIEVTNARVVVAKEKLKEARTQEDPEMEIEEEEPEEEPVEELEPLPGHGDQFDAHPNQQPGNMNGWVDEDDDDEEEDEDEENEDADMEEDDDADIIFLYEAEDADDELEVEEAGVEPETEGVDVELEAEEPDGVPEAFVGGLAPWALRCDLEALRRHERIKEAESETAKPLTKLPQKNKPFIWGNDEEKAFQTLKRKLCSAPILSLPEGSKDFVVYCDASLRGFGAVLMQREK